MSVGTQKGGNCSSVYAKEDLDRWTSRYLYIYIFNVTPYAICVYHLKSIILDKISTDNNMHCICFSINTILLMQLGTESMV